MLVAWGTVQHFRDTLPCSLVVRLPESFDGFLSSLINLVGRLAFGQVPPQSLEVLFCFGAALCYLSLVCVVDVRRLAFSFHEALEIW